MSPQTHHVYFKTDFGCLREQQSVFFPFFSQYFPNDQKCRLLQDLTIEPTQQSHCSPQRFYTSCCNIFDRSPNTPQLPPDHHSVPVGFFSKCFVALHISLRHLQLLPVSYWSDFKDPVPRLWSSQSPDTKLRIEMHPVHQPSSFLSYQTDGSFKFPKAGQKIW